MILVFCYVANIISLELIMILVCLLRCKHDYSGVDNDISLFVTLQTLLVWS